MHIYVYLFGKEEVFAHLAQEFDTKVVISSDRMAMIRAADYNVDSFTDTPDEDSWIFGRA